MPIKQSACFHLLIKRHQHVFHCSWRCTALCHHGISDVRDGSSCKIAITNSTCICFHAKAKLHRRSQSSFKLIDVLKLLLLIILLTAYIGCSINRSTWWWLGCTVVIETKIVLMLTVVRAWQSRAISPDGDYWADVISLLWPRNIGRLAVILWKSEQSIWLTQFWRTISEGY